MRLWAGILAVGLAAAAGAQGVPSGQVPVAPDRTNIKTDAQLDDEAKQADVLYGQSRAVDALPLYKDLHEQRPHKVFYTERLAIAYVKKAATLSDPAAKAQVLAQGKTLLLEAKGAGDTSDLVQVMLSEMEQAEHAPAEKGPRPAGQESLDQAELAFNKGDLKAAMELYNKAWAENPKLYAVPLFAGDAEFRQNHLDEAGMWFQRAIAIDPDRETAHRFWADALMKAGKAEDARREYIAAFVAQPYAKAPRLQLRSWAGKASLRYLPPPIVIPIQATGGKDGGTNINMDPARMADQNYLAWIGYPMQTGAWRKDKFAKTYPNESVYRHSLAEETEGLKTFLIIVRANKKLPPEQYDATTRTLMALDKDGMLECWILLDNPDQGVAQDYVAYRATHRDLLKAYVEKYDLHPA